MGQSLVLLPLYKHVTFGHDTCQLEFFICKNKEECYLYYLHFCDCFKDKKEKVYIKISVNHNTLYKSKLLKCQAQPRYSRNIF